MGMTWWQIMRRIVLPQALRTAVPSLSNSLISMIKDTSLACHEQLCQDTVLKCETRCLEELYHSCDLIARVAIHKKYRKRGMPI